MAVPKYVIVSRLTEHLLSVDGAIDSRQKIKLKLEYKLVKVKAAVRKMCAKCQIVRRKGYVYVVCKANPRHKQRQG